MNKETQSDRHQHPKCCSPVSELDEIRRVKLPMMESMRTARIIPKDNGSSEATVQAFRAHVESKGHCFDGSQFMELPKCNIRAAALRRDGNQLYAKRQFPEALMKYNESICAARADSEDLSMGYANRSAICVERRLNAVALTNIALAKKHNYPERLMPKLLDREAKCRSKLEGKSFSERKGSLVSHSLNVEPNPNIFSLANGIRAEKHPINGPMMVAERDFKVGDLILHEKPICISVSRDRLYLRCMHCYSMHCHMIPCPNCAAAMFCNEECLEKGHRLHRFECGVSSELSLLVDWLGPRMFFHGLSLFDDDIEKMMEFCKSAKGTGISYFNLDYSNYNAVEEFKAFIASQSQWPHNRSTEDPIILNFLKHKSAIFFAIYMKIPLVRALIHGKPQEDFMLQCFLDYQMIKNGPLPMVKSLFRLFPLASGFGYSCHPKTLLIHVGSELKLFVTRPIRHGEQIHISYESLYEQEPSEGKWKTNLVTADIKCLDDCCGDKRKQRQWLAKVERPSAIEAIHWTTLNKIIRDSEFTAADQLNALQQFLQRFGSHYPQKKFAQYVKMYETLVAAAYELELDSI